MKNFARFNDKSADLIKNEKSAYKNIIFSSMHLSL